MNPDEPTESPDGSPPTGPFAGEPGGAAPAKAQARDAARAKLWRARVVAALVAFAATVALAVASGIGGDLWGGIKGLRGDDAALALAVESNPDRITLEGETLGGAYVIPAAIQDVGAPSSGSSCVGRYAWAHKRDAVDVDSAIRVIVTGKSQEPAVVTGVDIVRTAAAAPTLGSHVTCPGRGAELEVRSVGIDLWRKRPPQRRYLDGGEFVFQLADNDNEVIYLFAHAHDCACTWEAWLEYSVGTSKGRMKIGSFTTTAPDSAKSYEFLDGRWVERSATVFPRASGPIMVPDKTACQLLDAATVATVLGRRVTLIPGSDAFSSDNNVVSKVSLCNFAVYARDGKAQDGNADILYSVARNAEDAKRQFDLYALTPATRPVAGLGDAAALWVDPSASAGGRIHVLHGRESFTVQVSRTVPGKNHARMLRQLAEAAAALAWTD